MKEGKEEKKVTGREEWEEKERTLYSGVSIFIANEINLVFAHFANGFPV